MSKMYPNDLWIMSYRWGNDIWANGHNDYSEHDIQVLTDIHPMIFIRNIKNLVDVERGKIVGVPSIFMHIPAGTIPNSEVNEWKDDSSWTYVTCFKEEID